MSISPDFERLISLKVSAKCVWEERINIDKILCFFEDHPGSRIKVVYLVLVHSSMDNYHSKNLMIF